MAEDFESILKKRGALVYKTSGESMLPLIRSGQDLVKILPLTEAPRRKDIVLFKYKGKYLLHRVVKVKKNGYDLCGDNCSHREKDINASDIIGKLSAVISNGKEKKLNGFSYSLYLFFRVDLLPLKLAVFRARELAYRVKCKLLKKNKKSDHPLN